MLLIEHRVNTVDKLRSVPVDRGVEIDIRDYDGTLRCVHDPLQSGEPLEDLLQNYAHRLAIFNVKCDGLEARIAELASQYRIEDYFFLDCAAPTLVQLALRGVHKIAVRYSEYEPIESAMAFAGKVDWVWIDCFSRLPLTVESYQRMQEKFKICLVSPELQHHGRNMIQSFRHQLDGMKIDAVCSDYCGDWVGI